LTFIPSRLRLFEIALVLHLAVVRKYVTDVFLLQYFKALWCSPINAIKQGLGNITCMHSRVPEM